MLKNAYLDAKIGFDPTENEPRKEGCVVAGTSVCRGAELDRAARDGDGHVRVVHGVEAVLGQAEARESLPEHKPARKAFNFFETIAEIKFRRF